MIRKTVKTIYLCVLLGLLVFNLFTSSLWANESVKVMGSDIGWPVFSNVDISSVHPFAEQFETIDPNFLDDGVTAFKGVRLSKLLDVAGVNAGSGITMIGSDQYVGFLPAGYLNQSFLVWEMNQKPIPAIKGGPLKIMFPDSIGMHTSCYTWYLEAIVADPLKNAELTVEIKETKKVFSKEELHPLSEPLKPALFSMAQGCRNEFEKQSGGKKVMAVPLSALLQQKGKPLDKSKFSFIQVKPFVGPAITFEPKILDYPVTIIISCDGHRLHPALGGPFSLVFPLEDYPELGSVVPESGALFFLEKIVAR